jgi:hypothetical protein
MKKCPDCKELKRQLAEWKAVVQYQNETIRVLAMRVSTTPTNAYSTISLPKQSPTPPRRSSPVVGVEHRPTTKRVKT